MIGFALLALTGSAMQDVSSERAEQFLGALVAAPSKSKPWFTEDAVVVFGDIGGTVAQALPVFESSGAWMTTCRVAQIERKPAPSSEELQEGPKWLKGGELSVFSGEYACARADTPNTRVKFNVVFKGNRVVMLALGEGPTHG